MYNDFDMNHEIASFGFWNIIQDSPHVSEEQKQKMMKAFESLSYYYKTTLLGQLEKMEKAGGRNNDTKKMEFIESYLFSSSDQALQKSTSSVLPLSTSEDVITPIVNKNREKKDYLSLLELENLTGLDRVKLEVRKLLAFTEMSKLRKKHNLKSERQSLHMIFKGNPGTGKTTVARLLGKILHEIGVLSIGHVIELDRSNLTSKYQGEIEQRISEYAEQAKGGILFIDEIYSLHQKGDHGDQGKQGIEVLLKVIEDKRDDFVCIGAGYVDEVNEFLGSNPGLLSRFSIHIDFDDYTIEQLLKIAQGMFEERDYVMDESFKELFKQCMVEEMKGENFANARVVRNIVESAIREQSLRLFNSDKIFTEKDLITITGADFKYEPVILKKVEEVEKQKA